VKHERRGEPLAIVDHGRILRERVLNLETLKSLKKKRLNLLEEGGLRSQKGTRARRIEKCYRMARGREGDTEGKRQMQRLKKA